MRGQQYTVEDCMLRLASALAGDIAIDHDGLVMGDYHVSSDVTKRVLRSVHRPDGMQKKPLNGDLAKTTSMSITDLECTQCT